MLSNMKEISDSFAKEHIERWINAWNNRDLETVLSMFTEDIEFRSPKIKVITPEFNSEKVNNKKDLKHYWSTAKEKLTSLHFASKEYYVKGNTCVLEYIATFNGETKFLAIEKSEFNEDYLIYKASAFYGPQVE